MFYPAIVTSLTILLSAAGCNNGLGTIDSTAHASIQQEQGSGTAKTQHPGLMDPSKANEKAPDKYRVQFETTKGKFVIACDRSWSPNGADRFYNMCKVGYMNDIAIFRAIKGFMFQFGIHGDPAVNDKWFNATIKDDPGVKEISNGPGFITFAKTGAPNSRSTQLFINLGNNNFLDSDGFTPFGQVVEGMDVIKKINTEYGENPRTFQRTFKAKGNAYVKQLYPNIDFIKSVKIMEAK